MVMGDRAHFFCQIQGYYGDMILRINGRITALNFQIPSNLVVTTENGTPDDDMPYTNISINITASKKRNNTVLECYNTYFGRQGASKATLIVRGTALIFLSIPLCLVLIRRTWGTRGEVQCFTEWRWETYSAALATSVHLGGLSNHWI